MSENHKSDSKRLSRHDSSESIINKCGNWSLNNDEKSTLMESMGVSFLPDVEENEELTSNTSSPTILSTSSFSEMSVNERVLQTLTSSLNNSVMEIHNEQNNEEFFVFKRRRLNSVIGEDKINLLYDEHMLHIFKFLPKYMLARCAQVCKRWKRICFDETLWKRLDLGGKALKPGVVGRVLIRGTKILRLAKAEITSPAFSPQLHHLSPNVDIQCKLTHIDLSMAAVETSVLEEMFSVCRQLQKVSLELCTVSNLVCEHLSQNARLDTLNMAMCYNLESTGLTSIFTRCRNLQALNLAWTSFDDKELRIICCSLPLELVRLNISGCRESMIDEYILLLSKSCPNLVELDLSDSIRLTGDSLAIIIANLLDIECLAFSRCYGIAPKLYLNLKSVPHLNSLEIHGIFSESDMLTLKEVLAGVDINSNIFSSVARPTVGIRRTSIWGQRVRDRFS